MSSDGVPENDGTGVDDGVRTLLLLMPRVVARTKRSRKPQVLVELSLARRPQLRGPHGGAAMTAPADRTAPADPTGATAVDPAAFRAAMARHAAGVVVTTWDAEGRGRGVTATSFCSVSADPPLILVCLAEPAGSFTAFSRCTRLPPATTRVTTAPGPPCG